MIIILRGLPGTGKTTIAKEISLVINISILSSDKIRKELFEIPSYNRWERKLVYDVMLLITKYLHNAGHDCLLDATFSRKTFIEEIHWRIKVSYDEIFIIECRCSENIILSRIRNRKNDYSDANVETYRRMRQYFEPVSHKNLLILDTSLPIQFNIKKILSFIKK